MRCGWLCSHVVWFEVVVWCGDPDYSVLQSTTPYCKVLTTPYYKVQQSTTQYYSVLQSTTKYYSVLQSSTPVVQSVLLSTTPVLQSTTPVLQSTTPVLHSTTPVLQNTTSTTKYYSSATKYCSVLQSITEFFFTVLLRTTKCCNVLLCTETLFTMRRATSLTLQRHQILHPAKQNDIPKYEEDLLKTDERSSTYGMFTYINHKNLRFM